ncbi:MAG: HAMP domain-containing histidine kinase [Halanaerobiales bacterium]|nr:HAMP domain-containing histidine kinase [Halanaerobiales bacterium]
MKKKSTPFHWLFSAVWVILICSVIFFLVSSYLKEVELINNTARLELLQVSFAFHPKTVSLTSENEGIIYYYLINSDGTLVEESITNSELALKKIIFPEEDLRFIHRKLEGKDILQLEKLLRKGRETEEKQGLIIGMDYDPYLNHEYRALIKYLLMLIGILGLVALAIISRKKWVAIQTEMVRNERFIYTGKLSRQVAHEIKNPLGVMQATVDYLKELDDPDMMKEELEDISGEIQRLNRLVERIRTFAKGEKPNLEKIEVGTFLNIFVQRVQHRFPGLIASFDDPGSKVKVCVDRDQLTQVFLNLVQNSYQSYSDDISPEERKILLGMHFNRRNVEIFIQDWGEPIPKEIKDKLFDPFVTSKTNGSGLGLAISRQILKAHNGQLLLQADDDSKRFTVILPL